MSQRKRLEQNNSIIFCGRMGAEAPEGLSDFQSIIEGALLELVEVLSTVFGQ